MHVCVQSTLLLMDQDLRDESSRLIEKSMDRSIGVPCCMAGACQTKVCTTLLELGLILNCSPGKDRAIAIALQTDKLLHKPSGDMSDV